MNKKEYAEYQAAVAEFMEREGLANLSSGPLNCPECHGPLEEGECGEHGYMIEPFFSWRPCECCGSHLGGNREHAAGFNPTTGAVQEYVICEDCVYYAEYGRLDDTTMLEVEQS
jgi:hypothetical protein